MAQDKFQPVVSGIGNPVYIRPGVQDNSAAALLGTVPTLIGMADKAYEEYSLNKAINTEVKPIIDTYEAGYQGNKDAGALVGARETIFQEAQGVPNEAQVGLIDANAAQLDAALAKVKAAEDQGILSPAQAMAKITKATREAVAKNPWLEAQLYERVQQHLKRTGTLDVWKEREGIAQSNAEMMQKEKTYFRTEFDNLAAKGADIEPFNEYGSPEEWRAKLNVAHDKINRVERAKAAAESGAKLDVDNLKKAISTGEAGKTGNALVGNFTSVTMKLLSNTAVGSQERLAALERMRLEAVSVKGMISKLTAPGMADPTVKAFTESYLKQIDEYVGIFEKKGSAEDMQKAIRYKAETTANLQAIEAAGFMNSKAFATVKMLAETIDPVRGLGPILNEPGNKAQKDMIWGAVSSMMQGAVDNRNVQEFFKSQAPTQMFVALGQGVLLDDNPYRHEEKVTGVLTYVDKMAEALTSQETMQNPKDQAESSLRFLSAVASKPEFKTVLSTRSEYGQSVGRVVDNHMNGVIDTFAAVVFKHSTENPSLKFTYDVKENGAFEMITNDPTVSKAINEKLSTQVNIALDAYANSLGISRQQAAPAFYSQYFAELTAQDKDLVAMSKPKFEIRSPEDLDAAMKAGYINKETFEAIKEEMGNYNPPVQATETPANNGLLPLQDAALAKGEVPLTNESEVRQAYEEGLIDEAGFKENMAKVKPKGKEQSTVYAEQYLAEREAYAKRTREYIKKVFTENPTMQAIDIARNIASKIGGSVSEVIDDVLTAEEAYRKNVRKKAGIK